MGRPGRRLTQDVHLKITTCDTRPGPLGFAISVDASRFILDDTRPITEWRDGSFDNKRGNFAYLPVRKARSDGKVDWTDGQPRCIVVEGSPSDWTTTTDFEGRALTMAPLSQGVAGCAQQCSVASEQWTVRRSIEAEGFVPLSEGILPKTPRICPMTPYEDVSPEAGCWIIPGSRFADPRLEAPAARPQGVPSIPASFAGGGSEATGMPALAISDAWILTFAIALSGGGLCCGGVAVWCVLRRRRVGGEHQQPLVHDDVAMHQF